MKNISYEPSVKRHVMGVSAAQKGSALLISLVMLLLISIIAVGAMQSSIMQERMSSNMHDRELAFQAAEAALRDAENYILATHPDVLVTENFVYVVNAAGNPSWSANPLGTTGTWRVIPTTIQGVAQQPQYYIELIDRRPPGASTELGVEDPGISLFRVTARGFGGTAQTVAVLTSVYRRQ